MVRLLTFLFSRFVRINGTWEDDLIWCPSQCYYRFTYKGTSYIIYLRWRHDDPWTAELIEGDFVGEHWRYMDVGYHTESNWSGLKPAAIKEVKRLLFKRHFLGIPIYKNGKETSA